MEEMRYYRCNSLHVAGLVNHPVERAAVWERLDPDSDVGDSEWNWSLHVFSEQLGRHNSSHLSRLRSWFVTMSSASLADEV